MREFFDETIARFVRNVIILAALIGSTIFIPSEIVVISMLWAIYIKL